MHWPWACTCISYMCLWLLVNTWVSMRTEGTWVSGTLLFKEYTGLRGRLEWGPGLYQRAEKGQQGSGKGCASGAGRDGRWFPSGSRTVPWKKPLSFCRQRVFAWVGAGWAVGVLCRCRFMLGFSSSKSVLLGHVLSLVPKSALEWSARLGIWSLWKRTQQKGKRQTDSFQLDQFPGLADAYANRRTKVGTGVGRKWKYPFAWQFELKSA